MQQYLALMLGLEFFRVPGLAVGHIHIAGLLLTVKANVDRLMGYDKSETDMEVERQEER